MIEQCRRLEVIHQDENEELKQEDELNSKWLIIHNDGHKELMDDFVDFLKSIDNKDKRVAKKWLKKSIKRSNDIIEKLDVKYNDFANDEVMSQEDEIVYHMNDGAICIAYTLINIIDKRRYINK